MPDEKVGQILVMEFFDTGVEVIEQDGETTVLQIGPLDA